MNEGGSGVYSLRESGLSKTNNIFTFDDNFQKNIYPNIKNAFLSRMPFNSSYYSTAFSIDGKNLAFNNWGELSLYSFSDFRVIKSTHAKFSEYLTFSPDNRWLFYNDINQNAPKDITIKGWELTGDKSVQIYKFIDCGSCNMNFTISGDGKSLWFIDSNNLTQFDLSTNEIGKQYPIKTLIPNGEYITWSTLVQHPDQPVIYLASVAGDIYELPPIF